MKFKNKCKHLIEDAFDFMEESEYEEFYSALIRLVFDFFGGNKR